MAAPVLLLRKGRALTPRSRLRYRLKRLTTGRTAGIESDDVLGLMALVVRVVTLPFVIAFDYALWPITSRTLGRGPWWIVELRFHGPDAEFVRVAEADSREEAQVRLERILATHVPGPGDQ